MAALVGVIAGQERAQVFHGQLRQAVFGDRQPAFVGRGFDQGANIEVVQGARGKGDAQRGFTRGDRRIGHGGLLERRDRR